MDTTLTLPTSNDSLSPSQITRVEEVCDRFEADWKVGLRPRIEDYLGETANPERAALWHELLVLELAYRRRQGERPTPEEYWGRFPALVHLVGKVLGEAETSVPQDPQLPTRSDHSGRESPDPEGTLTQLSEFRTQLSEFRTRPPEESPGKAGWPEIADYDILAELGRGGMGVIYQARQLQLNRLVALKMIRAGLQAKPEDLDRFRIEAEAVARLHHVNIVQIHNIGEVAGLPFVALELLEGGSLADRLADTPQQGRQAADLMVPLARAIHAAHQAGIVHRDLKPSNILFDRDGTPKIVDFGLAKRLEVEDGQTVSGQVMGTPSYMAPEQAQGLTRRIGPPADIYALGAILYEMLTGRPPFKGPNPMETLRQVVYEEVVPPSRLQSRVPRDLETICLKCLDKEPKRRYGSAEELAEDLERWLAREPIRARPVGAWEWGWRWVKRRPAAAALVGISGLAALALILAAGILVWALVQAETERATQMCHAKRNGYCEYVYSLMGVEIPPKPMRLAIANQAETERATQMRPAEVNGYRVDVYSPMGVEIPPKPIHLAEVSKYNEYLYLLIRKTRRILFGMVSAMRPAKLREVVVGCMGDFSGFNPVSIDLNDREKTVAVHPETNRCAIVDPNCRPCPGKNRAALTTTGRQLIFYSRAIFAGCDGMIRVWGAGGRDVWKCAHGAPLDLGDGDFLCAAITLDGKYLAVGTKRSSTIWMCDLSARDPRLEKHECPGRHRQLTCLAFNASGNRLAAGYREEIKQETVHRVSIWSVVDASKGSLGPEEGGVESRSGEVRGAAFSPDGKFLAVCSEGIAVFETPDHFHNDYHPYITLGGDRSDFAEFSPDSQLLAYTCAQRQEVQLWSVSTRRRVAILKHQGPVKAAMFRRDGRELVVAGPQSIRLWDLACAEEKTTLAGHTQGVPGVAFSPDGKWLVSVSKDRTVRVWDPVKGVPLKTHTVPGDHGILGDYGQTVAFSPDGKMLAIGDWAGVIQIWDVSAERVEGWRPLEPIKGSPGEKIWTVGFSWDGRYFAAGGESGLKIWRVTNRRLENQNNPTRPLARHDEQPPLVKGLWFDERGRLAWAGAESKGEDGLPVANEDAPIRLHLLDRGKKKEWKELLTSPFPPLDDGVLSVAFRPAGKQLVFVDDDANIMIIDPVNGQKKRLNAISRHKEAGGSVLSLSPDGAWLAVQSGLAAEVWDMRTGELLFRLPEEHGIVWSLSWNPDKSRWDRGEKQLAVGTSDGGLFLWDIGKVRAELDRMRLGW